MCIRDRNRPRPQAGPIRSLRRRRRPALSAHPHLSLIHISEPTRLRRISYAVLCLKKNKIVELVTDYLEGDLDADTSTALEAHLDLCPCCARYVEQIRETVSTLGDV